MSTSPSTHSSNGRPWCTDRECRAKWNHAHGVQPGYPTVIGLATTKLEAEHLESLGFTIYAPNF